MMTLMGRMQRFAATGFLCLIDLWIASGVLAGGLEPVAGLCVHYAIVVLFGTLLLTRGAAFRQDSMVWIVLATLFGPISGLALAALALSVRLWPQREPPPVQAALLPETTAQTLARRIREGRRHALTGVLPPHYIEIFARGDLAAQERAMSAISRGYRPQMRPALQYALGSDIPAIRVQAAAIHAKLRGHFEGEVRALSAEGAVHDEPSARRAVEAARSGFVKPALAAELLKKADAVDQGGPPLPVNVPTAADPARRRPLLAPPRLKRYACGGIG